MEYLFEEGRLFSDKIGDVLCAKNIRLGIKKGPVNYRGNAFFNGMFEVKGKLNNICHSNESKIKRGDIFSLKLCDRQAFSLVPILFIDILNINPTLDKRRDYEWFFCAINRPIYDHIKLIEEEIREGEISLEELIFKLGDLKVETAKFNSEGGLLN